MPRVGAQVVRTTSVALANNTGVLVSTTTHAPAEVCPAALPIVIFLSGAVMPVEAAPFFLRSALEHTAADGAPVPALQAREDVPTAEQLNSKLGKKSKNSKPKRGVARASGGHPGRARRHARHGGGDQLPRVQVRGRRVAAAEERLVREGGAPRALRLRPHGLLFFSCTTAATPWFAFLFVHYVTAATPWFAFFFFEVM